MQSRSRAIKTLDYAMSGAASTPICEAFIEALGLKTLFSAFMGKVFAACLIYEFVELTCHLGQKAEDDLDTPSI